MNTQKYSVNQHQISTFLAFVKDGQIAIPEVQRPFVWDSTRVRDLIDSLYRGYPIGYVITWQNPNVRLKDGKLSEGKKILIDGQQRITALRTAVLGEDVINKEYQKVKIKIAFNPLTETFEVQNPAILKDKNWIPDISEVLDNKSLLRSVNKYLSSNPDVDENLVENSFSQLLDIHSKQIGTIDLAHDLDIETVTTIFIRINKQGVELSQADFAMSKIASNERYEGPNLRKAIDYFCHLAVAPHFFDQIKSNDKEFAKTDYFRAMTWLKDEKDDLYDPSYTDVLRVAFTTEFHRGRLSDLVSLLSGRNFETREYIDSISEDTFGRMRKSLFSLMNETNFKQFVMVIRSSGFISSDMIRSQNTLNFAYIIYLKLKEQKVPKHDIARMVSRWFVLSVLTGRYGGSPESVFDYDIKQIASRPFNEYLSIVEKAELSDAFWEVGLIQKMNTSISSSPVFNVFQAAMVKSNDKGFLSRDITVADIILYRGDIHHIFPKGYLKEKNKSRAEYNQIANYVLMQQEINIAISDKPPGDYFNELKKQCTGEINLKYGGIDNLSELMANLKTHCIPVDIFDMTVENFGTFLEERRKLMAQKMKSYYYSL